MNKTLLFALAGVLLFGAAFTLLSNKTGLATSNDDVPITPEVVQQWKLYKSTYHKRFSDPDVEAYRIEIFAQNLQVVQEDTTGTYGVTQFFDLSPAEFKETYLTLEVATETQAVHDALVGDTNINWVQAGAVTSVKNQESCGSCWAFSTTGSLESALIINGAATNTIDLSEQQLVDCSTLNAGCNGGLMDRAFNYIKNNSISTESTYPYAGVKHSKCDKAEITGALYTLTGHTDVSQSTSALLAALAKQPVSIAVDATNWSYYTNGVFSNCGTTLNHGVLLVGFQDNAWLVKNSWGTSWGQAGYIQLASGNTCGLANSASYPTGAKAK